MNARRVRLAAGRVAFLRVWMQGLPTRAQLEAADWRETLGERMFWCAYASAETALHRDGYTGAEIADAIWGDDRPGVGDDNLVETEERT